MINMAVINLKDIIKYLVKITIVIIIVVSITRYFSSIKADVEKTTKSITNSVEKQTFLSCLDVTVPGIEQTHNTNNTANNENDVLEKMLSVNLGMIDNIKKETNISKENEVIEQSTTEENKVEENETENVIQAETGLKTEVQPSNVPNKYTSEFNGVQIRNETDYELTEEILNPEGLEVNSDNIIIYHTHACESYTASEKYQYEQTGNFRTTDKNFSVVRVGTELTNQLKSYKFNVIHSETLHDYPSYTGSYSNSLATVTKLLEENKNTDIVLDLHRDAIGDNTYAPTVKIGDEYAAQLMFVVGGNGSAIPHENWQQNLKFAIKVQEKANELYPGLFKPIILRESGYNQQVSKAASLIEVGATGNTLDQCLVSMKYLAKVLDEVL